MQKLPMILKPLCKILFGIIVKNFVKRKKPHIKAPAARRLKHSVVTYDKDSKKAKSTDYFRADKKQT